MDGWSESWRSIQYGRHCFESTSRTAPAVHEPYKITSLTLMKLINIKCSPGFGAHCVEAKSAECKCACYGLNHGSKIMVKCSEGVEGSCQYAVYGECTCACNGF